MLTQLITATSPGRFDFDAGLSPVFYWLIAPAVVIAALVTILVQYRLGQWAKSRREFDEVWTVLFGVVLVVAFLATAGISIGYSETNAAAERAALGEWRASVSDWLADEYGLTVTGDEVESMTPGDREDGLATLIDGEITHLELELVAGNQLIVIDGDDNVISPRR